MTVKSGSIDVTYKCLPETTFLYLRFAYLGKEFPPQERGNILKVDSQDAKNRNISFTLTDLEYGRELVIGLEAFNKKDDLIDRISIKTKIDKEKKEVGIPALSGLWLFDKPGVFNKISNDATVYDGVLIKPLKQCTNMMQHECLLYSKSGKIQKLQDASFYLEENSLRTLFDEGVSSNPDSFIVVGVDVKDCFRQADSLVTSSDFLNKVLFNQWEYSYEKDEFKMWVFELKRKNLKNVNCEYDQIQSVVKSLKDEFFTSSIIEKHENNFIFLGGVIGISVFRPCRNAYLNFCLDYKDKVTVSVDMVDVYLYNKTLRRERG